ncbi:MAG: hypothetical protein EPO24_15815 [Bacteroidetes bacterium]|nr:MAG: hypothetical protein EPO24_15815 [Bacteroidota bacterium]
MDEAERLLKEAKSFEEAKNKIAGLVSPEFINKFGEGIFARLQLSDALGRSYVIEKDRYYSEKSKKQAAKYFIGKYTVTASGLNWFAGADERVKVSFDLVPQAAVDAMREKSFWLSGIENKQFLDAIQKKLEQALKDGTGYKEFAQGAREVIETMGYSGDEPLRLSTVYRTNLFSAYSLGQMEQIEQVKDRFPMWRYVAIRDNRTRESHLELDGKVFRVGEGPVPPIDFNCRCSAQYIHVSETAGLEPWSVNNTERFMKRVGLEPFDMHEEYRKWLEKKQKEVNERVKEAVRVAIGGAGGRNL